MTTDIKKLTDDITLFLDGNLIRMQYKDELPEILEVCLNEEVSKRLFDKVYITDKREDAVQFHFEIERNKKYSYHEYSFEDKELHSIETDFDDMSEAEIKSAISGFYDSIEQVKEIYGEEEYKMIVIECDFENNIY